MSASLAALGVDLPLIRMDAVCKVYDVPGALSVLPQDNPTLAGLTRHGLLLCAWVHALANDLTPPEVLPEGTQRACIGRVAELAMLADGCAYKAGNHESLQRKLGPKAKTLPEILANIYAWAVLMLQEQG